MRIGIVLRRIVAALLVAASVPFAGAAPSTTAFDALRADLEAREAVYEPPLASAQQRELRAIQRSLARIGRPHADVAADVRSAAAVAKFLKGGFPGEFVPATATSDLAGLVAEVFQSLLAAVESDYARLDEALESVSDAGARSAAAAKLASARAALDAAASPSATPAAAARQLQRAIRLAGRGLAIASPYVDGFVTARVSGRTFVATDVQADYVAATRSFYVTVTQENRSTGAKQSISFLVRDAGPGSHELGAFDLFAGNWALYIEGEPADDLVWYSQFTEPPGVVTLSEWDPDAGRAAGTFSFLAMRNGDSRKTVKSGKFRLANVVSR